MDTITLKPNRPTIGNIRVVDSDGDGGVGGGGADGRIIVDGDSDGGAGGRRSPARLAVLN